MIHKTIFITGAASGIGKETARLFAGRDWKTGLFDIDLEGLQTLQQELGQDKASIFVGDVTDAGQLKQALDDFCELHRYRLDVMFNNAGILQVGEYETIPLEAHHRLVEVNLIGVMNGTYAALPYLKQTPGSRILNTCSASAYFGHPELTTYAATKAAVKSLTEGWNVAFEKYDIVVTDLLPIYVRTEMTRQNLHLLPSLKESDIRLTPEKIARIAWKAVHKKRMHWPIGADTKLLRFLMRFFTDPINKWVLKKVIRYR